MKEIAHLAEKIAERYYEIPKGSAQRKMPDYRQYILLCTEAVYSVPVGTECVPCDEFLGSATNGKS